MKTKYFLIASALTLILTTTGCSNDEPTEPSPLGCAWGEQTKQEADALSNALVTMATSPSVGSCENVRATYIDYIDALEKLKSCVLPGHRQAFDQALKDGKAELEQLDCNQDFGS